MFPTFMDLWEPIAKEKLKPGTRILSHDYKWDAKFNWPPDQTVSCQEHDAGPYRVHVDREGEVTPALATAA